jgi:hypothetical protein
MHSTNYFDTFIELAEDCPVTVAEVPPQKAVKTAASIIFDMVQVHPYQYTSDELIFHIHALKNGISASDMGAEKERFFAKGQPCLRSSPLGKRYGWGIHNNSDGRVAIYAVESDEYKKLSSDKKLKILKAMRSKRNVD